MAYGATQLDAIRVPLSSAIVPGNQTPIPTRGSLQTIVDVNGNTLTSVVVGRDFFELANLSATALNSLLVPVTDVSNFAWWSLSIVGNNHVGQLSWEGSNDNFASAAVGMYAYQQGVPSAYFLNDTNVGNAVHIFHGPVTSRYFRVRQNAYTSGSATGTLELYAFPSFAGSINAIQTGNWDVGLLARTSNGPTTFRLISAATNNASSIKGSGGQVYGYDIYNTNAAVRYVKLYNKATAPAPATDNALLIRTIGVPPAGRAFYHSAEGLAGFTNGIGLATVTGIADTDNTAVALNDLAINVDWF